MPMNPSLRKPRPYGLCGFMIAPLTLPPLPIPLDRSHDGVLMGTDGLLTFQIGCGLLPLLDELVKECCADLVNAVDGADVWVGHLRPLSSR
jgi:hypothetical protein